MSVRMRGSVFRNESEHKMHRLLQASVRIPPFEKPIEGLGYQLRIHVSTEDENDKFQPLFAIPIFPLSRARLRVLLIAKVHVGTPRMSFRVRAISNPAIFRFTSCFALVS